MAYPESTAAVAVFVLITFASVIVGVTRADVYGETETDLEAKVVKCNESYPCFECGKCKCQPGYIRRSGRCFPERSNYMDTCFFSFQCTTYPMVCDVEEDGLKHCVCHRFFNWSTELTRCMHMGNISAMASELVEKFSLADRIHDHAVAIFPGVVAAGAISLSLGAFLALGCVVFICYRGNWYICDNSWTKGSEKPKKNETAGPFATTSESPA